MKLVALCAVPPGATTAIVPVFAPGGTVAVIRPSVTTLKAAALFLNVTDVAPVKPDPLIVTSVPGDPLLGLKLEIVGAGTTTVKLAALVAVPSGVVTRIWPDVAPAGTVAVTCDAPPTVKVAAVPLKVTDEAPVKFEPLIVTVVPTPPLTGVKPLIDGAVDGVVTVNAEL